MLPPFCWSAHSDLKDASDHGGRECWKVGRRNNPWKDREHPASRRLSQRAVAILELRRPPGKWVFPAPTQRGHIEPPSMSGQHAKAGALAKVGTSATVFDTQLSGSCRLSRPQPSFWGLAEHSTVVLSSGQERIRRDLVTGNYFAVLGVKPAVGRLLIPAEKSARVAVIGYGLWACRNARRPTRRASKIDLIVTLGCD